MRRAPSVTHLAHFIGQRLQQVGAHLERGELICRAQRSAHRLPPTTARCHSEPFWLIAGSTAAIALSLMSNDLSGTTSHLPADTRSRTNHCADKDAARDAPFLVLAREAWVQSDCLLGHCRELPAREAQRAGASRRDEDRLE
jgi:hypothetical protein